MLSKIENKYGSDSSNAVTAFFENVGLPIPKESRQFTETNDDGYIVFLDSAACVLRLTDDKYCPQIDDPGVLQPLFSRKCGALRADIMPGVVSPVAHDEIRRLEEKLEENRISFFDTIPANAGYLPLKTPEFPKGVPVVIDMGACRTFNKSVSLVKRILNRTKSQFVSATTDDIQTELFGTAKTAFERAWPKLRLVADKSLMAAAWRTCAALKKQGILVAQWKTTDAQFGMDNYKNMKLGSRNYAALCRAELSGTSESTAPYAAIAEPHP